MPAVLWVPLVWLGLAVLLTLALARWFRWLRDGDEAPPHG